MYSCAVFPVFQKQSVDVIIHPHMVCHPPGFRQIYHCHERMQGRQSVQLVVRLDAVQLYDFVHMDAPPGTFQETP